jgi:hypothetical protein
MLVKVILFADKTGKVTVSLDVTESLTLTLEDVRVFTYGAPDGDGKGLNAKNNDTRERIFKMLSDMSPNHDYLQDPRWQTLKQKYDEVFAKIFKNHPNTLAGTTYDKMKVEHLGGRKYHHDFEVTYYNGADVVLKIPKLEFKKDRYLNISNLPQVLQIPVRTVQGENIINKKILYDEYFYNNYLDRYIELTARHLDIKAMKPGLDEYLKKVKNTNHKVHHMFTNLKENEKEKKAEKFSLVNDSIHSYLLPTQKNDINFVEIQRRLIATQSGKEFVIWNGKEFSSNVIPDGHLRIKNEFYLKSGRNKNYHTIVIKSEDDKAEWQFLLRWKNNKGINNPAWQIKYVTRK